VSSRIEDLAPDVQPKARDFLSRIPIRYAVTSTRRTVDEQLALFAQGKGQLALTNALRARARLSPIGDLQNKTSITECDGVIRLSSHQGGRALDVVPADEHGNPTWPAAEDPRWLQIAAAGKAAGFTWGGDWTDFPDRPHYEMK
jgi:hypothetical protein